MEGAGRCCTVRVSVMHQVQQFNIRSFQGLAIDSTAMA